MNTRDGKSNSPWEKAIPFVAQKDTTLPRKYNVLIVGAGITGITSALMLQAQGLDCLLIDTNVIGAGTTGGTSAHLNTFLDTTYPEIESDFSEEDSALVAKATKEAIGIIRSNVDQLQIDADLEEKVGFLFAEEEKQQEELKEIYEAAKRAGVEVSEDNNAPLPVPFLSALRFEQQAQFHPIKYVSGLLKEFMAKGGEVLEHTTYRSSKYENNVHVVQLDEYEIFAEHLIFATHIPPGINLFNFSCAPYRSYVVGAELLDDQAYPDCLSYDMQEPYHYWRRHQIDGKSIVLVGGEDHKTGQGDPEEAIQKLKDYVRQYVQVKDFVFEWSSQYYIPADGLPYIGKMPMADENTWVATGFNGNGMIWGTMSAKIISDLIIVQQSEYEKLLNPARLKPVAGFKEFVSENANVAWRFIADRFTAEQFKVVDTLAANEGVVVDSDAGKIAVSKTEDGSIKAISAVCTHAGCIVKFNALEQSWDCPCHGGRYDTDGKVITGPPIKDLEQLNWSELNP